MTQALHSSSRSRSRPALVACSLLLAGCATVTTAPRGQPEPPTSAPDSCLAWGGGACCPSRLGLDPELVRERCGFSEYLGERPEASCVFGFRDRDGVAVELRTTAFHGLSVDEALELHESSFVGLEGFEREVWSDGELRGLTWTAYGDARWGFVPGWPQPRRVFWQASACADGPMLEVVREMFAAPVDEGAASPLPEFELTTEPIPIAGLLSDRAAVTHDPDMVRLPDDAPLLAEAVLDLAASDDLDGFVALLDADARWGLPDRRQIGGRPIGTDRVDARPIFDALRRAASRIATGTAVTCPAPDRRLRGPVAAGEHPLWCYWISDDQLDIVTLSLRVIERRTRIEYLGLFVQRPTEPVSSRGEPPAPPMTPPPPLVCGDPHHEVEQCLDSAAD